MTTMTPATTNALLLHLGLIAVAVCGVACDAEPRESEGERVEICGPEADSFAVDPTCGCEFTGVGPGGDMELGGTIGGGAGSPPW